MNNIYNIMNIINYKDILIPTILIPGIDFLLCKCFGNKTRWFQLHSAVNMVIVIIIYNDIINLFINPLENIQTINTQIDHYFILILHIYHFFITDKLSFMDYFHHILFVGGGLIPTLFIYNNNLVRLGWFAVGGLPGSIEYLTLSLVKHDKMCYINQKRITAYMYNYIRYPITIYCPTLTYIAYRENKLPDIINPILLIYICFLLFFNGGFYNKLTIENYIIHNNRNYIYEQTSGYKII